MRSSPILIFPDNTAEHTVIRIINERPEDGYTLGRTNDGNNRIIDQIITLSDSMTGFRTKDPPSNETQITQSIHFTEVVIAIAILVFLAILSIFQGSAIVGRMMRRTTHGHHVGDEKMMEAQLRLEQEGSTLFDIEEQIFLISEEKILDDLN